MRNSQSSLLRWGCDHIQGILKIALQPVYEIVDFVKSCFLVKVYNAPETRFNLRRIFSLLPSLDLTNSKNIFTSDLKVYSKHYIQFNLTVSPCIKVISMVFGIKGGNARNPCPYCTYNARNEVEGKIRD